MRTLAPIGALTGLLFGSSAALAAVSDNHGNARSTAFRDCDACPLMVHVPAGSFTMGAPATEPWSVDDERPQHAVSVPAFALGVFEVTFAEWDACVAEGGCPAAWYNGLRRNRPAVNVSRERAQRYLAWLSRKTGRTYRLPTEAEWEYAARAGTTTPFHTGGTISTQQANYDGRYEYPSGDYIGGSFERTTVPVGSFAPNAFGLHDMHGNVREWVKDCWNGSYQGAPSDGTAWEEGSCDLGVLRGGSWNGKPWFLRSANRSPLRTYSSQPISGFRVASTLTPAHAGGDDHGNSRSSATRIALPRTTTGTIEPGNDADYFRFALTARTAIVMESRGDLDTLGTLFDERGARLAQDDDGAGHPNFSIQRTLDADVYYLRVHSRRTAIGGYTLLTTVAPGESFRDCNACPPMVAVPAGSFLMGAPESEPRSSEYERPQRTVSVPYFAASAHEVTFAEWDACAAEGGCDGYRPWDAGWGRGDRPVIHVSRFDALRYVDWLSRKTAQTYRLPTEAEWEYAARAGTTSPFHTGGTISPLQANYDGRAEYPSGDNEGGLYRGRTVPVGSFPPNAFGLYDVHGNAQEWVQNCAVPYAYEPRDRSSHDYICSTYILRGGSFAWAPWGVRSAARNSLTNDDRTRFNGFRVVRTLTPPGDDDHGNSRSFATRVALPSTTSGAIDPGNDTDYFRFAVAARGAVTIESSGYPDVLGTLFDAAGTLVVRDDDGAGHPNFRLEAKLDAGIYYVRVHSHRTTTGSYRLHLRRTSPSDNFRDCDACPLMVAVPAGAFTMGAPRHEPHSLDTERPQRTVYVSAFAMSALEVTFGEWGACVVDGGCGGYRPDDRGWGRGDRPVVNVGRNDARHYVDWLSGRTGQSYRLPSEAEWEYAARANTTSPFHTGRTISVTRANYNGRYGYPDNSYNESGLYRAQTMPVGSFAPNAFGLYDMHGNVWEWVQDCWNGGYRLAPTHGGAWMSGHCSIRISRGGSWHSNPRDLRSAKRRALGEPDRNSTTGFRVARTLAP